MFLPYSLATSQTLFPLGLEATIDCKTIRQYFYFKIFKKLNQKSTDKMLQQIGQDMTITEQQLRVHNNQTKKTVQLKRVYISRSNIFLFFKF